MDKLRQHCTAGRCRYQRSRYVTDGLHEQQPGQQWLQAEFLGPNANAARCWHHRRQGQVQAGSEANR